MSRTRIIFNPVKLSLTKKTFFILAALSATLLFSCGAGSGARADSPGADTSAATPPPKYDDTLPKGTVADSIACGQQAGQYYALYLPSYYSPSHSYPCIYFFDAHARGALPLRMYKALAEQYGFVLVGSDNAKNGMEWPETDAAVQMMMNDTRSRIHINAGRIYTAGFSGGARVASAVAIQHGGIAGVIGCAAGFPGMENQFQNKFNYFALSGVYDFNLPEVEQLDAKLQQDGFPHQMLTFTGKHEWPPVAAFRFAMLWLMAGTMKEHTDLKVDAVTPELKKIYAENVANADVIEKQRLLQGEAELFDKDADAPIYKKQLADVANSASYKNAIALQQQLRQVEASQQQQLAQQFTMQDEKWWQVKIKELGANAKPSKPLQEAQMNRRLINYLGLVSYMNINHALQTGDLPHALSYLHIFKMADPQNPDQPYLLAMYYMKSGDTKNAVAALNEAVALGYDDVYQLMNEPAFAPLKETGDMEKLVTKINAKK